MLNLLGLLLASTEICVNKNCVKPPDSTDTHKRISNGHASEWRGSECCALFHYTFVWESVGLASSYFVVIVTDPISPDIHFKLSSQISKMLISNFVLWSAATVGMCYLFYEWKSIGMCIVQLNINVAIVVICLGGGGFCFLFSHFWYFLSPSVWQINCFKFCTAFKCGASICFFLNIVSEQTFPRVWIDRMSRKPVIIFIHFEICNRRKCWWKKKQNNRMPSVHW